MKKRPTQMFKKIIGACGLLLLIQSAQAQFSFPVYEPFAYPETNQLGTAGASGINWSSGSSISSSCPIVTTNASLSFPGLPLDPNVPPRGLSTKIGSTSAKYEHAPFTAQTNGTVYCSFLLNIPSVTNSANTVILTLSSSTSSSTAGGVSVWLNPAGQLQLAKNISVQSTSLPGNYTSAATNTVALASGSTYLVVMGYTFNTNSSSDDEVDLWLNPTSMGNNGSIPTPTLSMTNGADATSLVSLFFYQAINIVHFYVDEIRVDNNWAGVTPAGPSPGPTFTVSGGGGPGCPGDVYTINLSGSVTTNIYLLYINSAFSGQASNGTGSSISFPSQSVSGVYTVLASNIVSGNVGWMNSNAVVSVLAGPVITTQPASVVVATNGYATFTVAATGNGLNYQWYKNGTGLNNGGDVSGAQTATLTIYPAETADIATPANGYYVIITNNCGLAATSTPIAALTLDAAANLVWQGGNPNTNYSYWDLSTTANWTNSAGSSVVFNAGDNVTFDNTSTNPVVTLVGVLAPGSINETASQNYAFTGSGSVAGSASLLMSGSGTLTISNANSYTGGTTISNGRVIVNDAGQMALGVGPVTLASGTLEIGKSSGSPTVGLSNINVTASSTLQIDGLSSEAFVILNALTGSPGATLTIYDKWDTSATADRIRLYGIFTNNGPIAITSHGNEVEIAPYNTTNGVQVYNGVISGSGGRFVPRGTGGVIFNNGNNIFNDSGVDNNGFGPSGYSVLLSSGNVGVGADAANWPNSSPLGTGILGIQVGAEGGTCSLFASGGAHTVANLIAYTSATNTVTLTLSGSNNLTLAGSFTLSGADGTGNTNRTINVNNTALTTISGVISDAGLGCGIIKIGSRTLALSAINTYSGPTTISNGTLLVNGQISTNTVAVTNGTLGGSGTVLGPVTVSSGGTLAPGTSAIGTLTINNSLTLNGNLFFKLQKGQPQSNDVASVSGTLTNGGTGTLTVTNAGPALVVGDKFKLFSKAVANGSTLGVSGGGVLWTNKLQVDGSISVTSLTVPTPVINSVILQDNGTNLVFSGTNGTADCAYSVLSSTNLMTPLANWVLQASGTFSGTGGFSYTNIITPGVPMRFFILRIP
jgi:autotransporter-associated beta strand protein